MSDESKSIYRRYDDLKFECARLSNANQVLRNTLQAAQDELRQRPSYSQVTRLLSQTADALIMILLLSALFVTDWIINGWGLWETFLVVWLVIAATLRVYILFRMLKERQ